MRYEQETAQRYCQHAKILRLIATYDDYEPTQRAILKIARCYEQMANIFGASELSGGQPDEPRPS